MTEERGSFTLVALTLSALVALTGTLIWKLALESASYTRLEQRELVRREMTQRALTERLSSSLRADNSAHPSQRQQDLCVDGSCFRIQLFPGTNPQPSWSRMLRAHPANLCRKLNDESTLYAEQGCSVTFPISPSGGYIFGNLIQTSPLTIQTAEGTITRLLILGSMRLNEIVVDTATTIARVEIVVAGDAVISAIRFSHQPVPTLLHLVRGHLTLINDGNTLDCSATQPIRLESMFPIAVGTEIEPYSELGCNFERDAELWQREFILGVQ